MRQLTIIFIFIFLGNQAFSQSEKKSIAQIRAHFKWINTQTDFVIAELNNEDFLEHPPHNGGQLKGYFKNDTLYKIVEWIGTSNAVMVTEYYLWNNRLIFVYYIEKSFRQIMDSTKGFIGFDYSKTEIKYQSRHYFKNGKEIKTLEKGEKLSDISYDFISKAESYKALLENKKSNQEKYDLIQGKWISTADSLSSIEFEGLIKVDYYDGDYIDQSKIKIDNNFLFCRTLKEHEESKYEIINLTDNNMTLLYLPVGKLLKYKKYNKK